MNKKFGFLVLISILVLVATSAFKAREPLHVSLLSVDFLKEKGVTLKFMVEGDARKSSLKGSIVVAGKTLRLHCNDNGDPTPRVVVCTAQKATAARYAGKPAVVTLAGYSFYFKVPARP